MKTHKDLDVWKNSIDFVVEIYKISEQFPSKEIYGLTSQIRRTAVSIPSNIAEGAARHHKKEFSQFLYIALSSCAEIDTQILIAQKLKYINEITFNSLSEKLNTISKMIQGLIKSLK